MKSRQSTTLLHILGCTLFLILPILSGPGPGLSLRALTNFNNLRELTAGILLIAFFYFNSYILVPRFYFTRRYVLFGLAVIVCFFIISLVPYFSFPEMRPPPVPAMHHAGMPSPPPGDKSIGMEFSHNFFRFFLVLFISLTWCVSNRWKQVEREKLSTELSYLKAQINPHFLFNTLNSIYSLAIQRSAVTAEAVVKLSGMMRYVIHEASRDFVPLEKEIQYLQSYIDLQRIRFDESLPLVWHVSGTTTGKRIAPLVLIPFIENAFKHGVNAEENASITITLHITDSHLNLVVTNNKVQIHRAAEEASGLGIENTRNRLAALYPAQHKLTIHDTPGNFSVSLTITLI